MTLVYQAYGKNEILQQVLFSVTSLLFYLKDSNQIRIVIYTDSPSVYNEFLRGDPRIHIEKISLDQIKKWRGKIDFVHRVKIEILKDAGRKFFGSIFYCDGDTYFKSSPEHIFSTINDSTSLMHISEGALNSGKSPLLKKMARFVKNATFDNIKIPANTVMWNAGVIGLSENKKNIFDKVLSLTDEMHLQYPKHVTEQLAVSYWLQTETNISAADEYIFHYWNQKEDYQRIIESFLSNNNSLIGALKEYSKIIFPPVPDIKKSFWNKLFRRS